jgi:hypothetical protein
MGVRMNTGFSVPIDTITEQITHAQNDRQKSQLISSLISDLSPYHRNTLDNQESPNTDIRSITPVFRAKLTQNAATNETSSTQERK